jgi:hypothetical protein
MLPTVGRGNRHELRRRPDIEYTERAEPSTRPGRVVLADDLGADPPDAGDAPSSVVVPVGVREEARATLLEMAAERQCAAVVARCQGGEAPAGTLGMCADPAAPQRLVDDRARPARRGP